MEKKKVYAYFDGSNFYHSSKRAYDIINVQFHHLTNKIIDLDKEKLVKIKYFNSPTNQEDNPTLYSNQQKFFEKLKATPFLDLYLGRLVKRPLGRINVDCPKCGRQKVESFNCPTCRNNTSTHYSFKMVEKGVDIKIGISLLLDAIEDKYDVALLFSGDSDFCPAIKHIIKELGKEIIFCHFPDQITEELLQCCSNDRIITLEMMKESMVE